MFQHREGGNFYAFIGSKEVPLKTSDLEKALKHLGYLDDRVLDFGPKAYQKNIGDLFPVFLLQKKKEIRASTYKLYDEIADIFEKADLYKVSLARINQKAWLKFCEHKSHSIKDFQNHRNLMHQFLVWCEMNEYINGVATLKNPKHKRRKRKVITPDHLLLIFKEAQKSRGGILCYLTFLAIHGPRGVEVRKLKKKSISFERRSAIIEEETVKTGEGREIPLNPIMLEILKIHFKRHEAAGIKTEWVFPNANDPKKHMSTTGFMTAWRTCIRNAGLTLCKYTPHDIRSTYEQWLEMSSLNETQKQKAVNASREVRLRTYVTMNADQLRGAEDVVDIPELIELLRSGTVALPSPLETTGTIKKKKILNYE